MQMPKQSLNGAVFVVDLKAIADEADGIETKASQKPGARRLRRYWVRGKGALKIRWGISGDYMRCVRHLSKYVGVRAKGLCNVYHRAALGAAPGKGHKSIPIDDPDFDLTDSEIKELFDSLMIEEKREFTSEQRDRAADSGTALPDGSYPIKNRSDLKNAISAFGRAKDQGRAKRHIIKRARALGAVSMLPEAWNVSESKSLFDSIADARDLIEIKREEANMIVTPLLPENFFERKEIKVDVPLLEQVEAALEVKLRRVRTLAGVRRYGQPIGSIILTGMRNPLRNLTLKEPKYEGFEFIGGRDGKDYDVGQHPKTGKWIATVSGDWNSVVESDSENGVYEALDAYVGRGSAPVQRRVPKQPTGAQNGSQGGSGGNSGGSTAYPEGTSSDATEIRRAKMQSLLDEMERLAGDDTTRQNLVMDHRREAQRNADSQRLSGRLIDSMNDYINAWSADERRRAAGDSTSANTYTTPPDAMGEPIDASDLANSYRPSARASELRRNKQQWYRLEWDGDWDNEEGYWPSNPASGNAFQASNFIEMSADDSDNGQPAIRIPFVTSEGAEGSMQMPANVRLIPVNPPSDPVPTEMNIPKDIEEAYNQNRYTRKMSHADAYRAARGASTASTPAPAPASRQSESEVRALEARAKRADGLSAEDARGNVVRVGDRVKLGQSQTRNNWQVTDIQSNGDLQVESAGVNNTLAGARQSPRRVVPASTVYGVSPEGRERSYLNEPGYLDLTDDQKVAYGIRRGLGMDAEHALTNAKRIGAPAPDGPTPERVKEQTNIAKFVTDTLNEVPGVSSDGYTFSVTPEGDAYRLSVTHERLGTTSASVRASQIERMDMSNPDLASITGRLTVHGDGDKTRVMRALNESLRRGKNRAGAARRAETGPTTTTIPEGTMTFSRSGSDTSVMVNGEPVGSIVRGETINGALRGGMTRTTHTPVAPDGTRLRSGGTRAEAVESLLAHMRQRNSGSNSGGIWNTDGLSAGQRAQLDDYLARGNNRANYSAATGKYRGQRQFFLEVNGAGHSVPKLVYDAANVPEGARVDTPASDLTPRGYPKPINWDDMGSSEKDLYEERMARTGDATVRGPGTGNYDYYKMSSPDRRERMIGGIQSRDARSSAGRRIRREVLGLDADQRQEYYAHRYDGKTHAEAMRLAGTGDSTGETVTSAPTGGSSTTPPLTGGDDASPRRVTSSSPSSEQVAEFARLKKAYSLADLNNDNSAEALLYRSIRSELIRRAQSTRTDDPEAREWYRKAAPRKPRTVERYGRTYSFESERPSPEFETIFVDGESIGTIEAGEVSSFSPAGRGRTYGTTSTRKSFEAYPVDGPRRSGSGSRIDVAGRGSNRTMAIIALIERAQQRAREQRS